MPQETRPMRPEDGSPISHTNAGSAAITKLADSPGINLSYYITGFILSGAGNGDGFSFLRRDALTFTAADNTIIVTDSADLEPAEEDFAIVFGIKTSDHTLASMISKWEAAGVGKGFNVEILNTGQVKVTFGDGSATTDITSYNKINDDNWHQVIVNWEYQEASGEGLNLYIDGELAATAASNKSLGTIEPTANFVVCGSDSKSFDISTLALYKGQTLSSAEIAALWNDGVGHKFTGSETGLTGAWNIDEGIGTDHQDLTINNNDGTSLNTTWGNNGVGFPIDPHTLKQTITYSGGIIDLYPSATGNDYAGVIPIAVVNLPHAIKIGRNNPIFISETDGGFGLELYVFKGSY